MDERARVVCFLRLSRAAFFTRDEWVVKQGKLEVHGKVRRGKG